MTETHDIILKSDRRGRIRFTPEQRTAMLDAYDASGLSGPKFAQLHDLQERRWRDDGNSVSVRSGTGLRMARRDAGTGVVSGGEGDLKAVWEGGGRTGATSEIETVPFLFPPSSGTVS